MTYTDAAESAENTEVSNTDAADTGISVAVKTIAGYNVLSRQAVERGELVEQMVFADLAAAYATELDAQVAGRCRRAGRHPHDHVHVDQSDRGVGVGEIGRLSRPHPLTAVHRPDRLCDASSPLGVVAGGTVH